MRIRDLSPKELKALKERSSLEYDNWVASTTDASLKASWEAAYGRGLNAGLEKVPDERKEP